jgi:hypothetical protein
LGTDLDAPPQEPEELLSSDEMQVDGDAGMAILESQQRTMSAAFNEPSVHERLLANMSTLTRMQRARFPCPPGLIGGEAMKERAWM